MASATDLRAIFFSSDYDEKQQTGRHSAVTRRKLPFMRSDALITKIVGTHRYQLTSSGRRMIMDILTALCSNGRPVHVCDGPTT
jgi:hypothetical protein